MKEEDLWFTCDELGNISEVDLGKEKGFDDCCYFCNFNELKPHQHHIIRKSDGGMDIPNNKLPLCANHHELIHRRVYILGFNPKQGFYYLIHRKTGKIIPPTEKQKKYKRKLPFSSIKYSKNLIVKGNLERKGIVIVKDFQRTRRIKQKRILKNLKKGVQ